MRNISYLTVAVLILGALLTSCDKNDDNSGTDDKVYPTTIYRLSTETLLQMNNDFAKRNPKVTSTVNMFGFLQQGASPYNYSSGGVTEEEGIAIVKAFVGLNPKYTGVINPDDVVFKKIPQNEIGINKSTIWNFMSEPQKNGGIEVLNTEILFCIANGTLVHCSWNHFPNVYVPKNFNCDVEQAKSKLLGKEVFHYGWGGQYSGGIVTAEHLQQCTSKLLIDPVTSNDKIELRVVWQISLPSMFYIFEIDVMTGDIIREWSTITPSM